MKEALVFVIGVTTTFLFMMSIRDRRR